MKSTDNNAASLPTPDEVMLATGILALGLSDLDGIRMSLEHAVSPNKPPAISLEQVGRLWLYASDCEMMADSIHENVTGLLAALEALYHGAAVQDQAATDHSWELLSAWHRDSVEGAGSDA